MAYYKTVTITGQAGAGTDYQVMLKVGETSGATGEDFDVENHATSFPSAKDDGGDLIFKNSDGSSNLSFWVEDVTGITPNRLATIWVEVADNLDSNKTIRCYYGHTSYSNLSNGANTFTFFDDFPGTSLDTGKWTTRGGSWAVANSVLTNTGTVLDGNKCLVDSPATANNYAMRSKMQNDYHNTSINYRMGLVSFANSSVNYDGYSYLIDRDTVTPPLLQKAFVDEYVAWDTIHAFAWTQDTWYTM